MGRLGYGVAAGVCLGVLALFAFFGGRDVRFLMALRDRGRVTQARVAEVWLQRGKSSTWMVRYAMRVPGFSGEVEEPWHACGCDARAGGTAPVTYLAERPQSHRFGIVNDRTVKEEAHDILVAAAVGEFIPVVLALGILGEIGRERELLSRGHAAAATIVSNEPRRKGGRAVAFRYAGPSGDVRAVQRTSAAAVAALQPGEIVTCLYFPTDVQGARLLASFTDVELVPEA